MKFRRFRSVSGLEILAGQDDSGNEQVSFRLGRPGDLWFHVHGFPGSHVVLRCPEDGAEPDRESVQQAAAAAAWFSRMREGGVVPVSVCLVRDVRKPARAKPGTVTIRNERKIKVRPALPAHSWNSPETGEDGGQCGCP